MTKGLKALEEIDKDTPFSQAFNPKFKERIAIIKKELKALEIIKVILFSKLKVFETTEKADTTTITKGKYYVIEFRVGKEKERIYIPKEEYDLLKEAVL